MPISPKTKQSKLRGKRFNKWLIIDGPFNGKYQSQCKWLCLCECGKEYKVREIDLIKGKSPRCRGCGFRGTPMQVKLGIPHTLCKKLRKAARAAIYRCTNKNDQSYHNYGGRGVTVYAQWIEDVQLFVAYLITLPGHNDPNLVLDRVENNKGYEPGNLRFVTWSVSNKNQRRYLGGENKSIA